MDSTPEQPPEDAVVFLTYGKRHMQPTAYRLLRYEAILIRALISGFPLAQAALDAKIAVNTAKLILARPEIAQYIEERMLEQAAAAGVTREKVLFAINRLLENPTYEPSQAHLKALDIAAKILKLIQPGLTINALPAASPFKDMDDEAFHAEFQKRFAYRNSDAQKLIAQEPKHDA